MSDEEKKKLYIYVLIAALLGGGGSTGMQMLWPQARNDPFTGSQGKELRGYIDGRMNEAIAQSESRHAESVKGIEVLHRRLTDLRKNTYTKEQEQNLHATLWKSIEEIKHADQELQKDIRVIFANLSKLPPIELLQRLTKTEASLKHIEEELNMLTNRMRGYR